LQHRDGALSGTVRLSVPTTFGHYRLPRMLQPFLERYPDVMVELSIANRNVDLVAEGYDLAIRLGALPDSGMVAHCLDAGALCLVAAPAYLTRAGVPVDLASLAGHACLPFVLPSTGRQTPWLLRDGSNDLDWMAPPRMRVCDDMLGTVSLAEQGLGICQTYRFIAQERLQSGALREVLPSSAGRGRSFSLIHSPHRSMSTAARALIDSLVGQVKDDKPAGQFRHDSWDG